MFSSILKLVDMVRHHRRNKVWDEDRALGRRGEDIAHRHLERDRMTVVARNFRTATGSAEVDLVAWDGDTLVFVEVKTRRTADYGPPDRAIGDEKRRAILRAAADYARRAGVAMEQIRFDVVSVVCSAPPAVEHFRDAFSARALTRPA